MDGIEGKQNEARGGGTLHSYRKDKEISVTVRLLYTFQQRSVSRRVTKE